MSTMEEEHRGRNFLSVSDFDDLFRNNEEHAIKTERSQSMGVGRSSSFRNVQAPQFLQVNSDIPRRGSAPNIQAISDKKDSDGPQIERVRSFRMTRKGIVNRGDRLRRKSNVSLVSTDSANSSVTDDESHGHLSSHDDIANVTVLLPETFKVAIVGGNGVGKHTLRNQFMTSEGICTSGKSISIDESERETSVCVLLDGEETLVKFIDCTDVRNLREDVDAYLVVFAVDNQHSFREAVRMLNVIRQEMRSQHSVILVANKADLARKRIISDRDARNVAEKYGCKYVETSVVLNHNIDELLVGIIRQTKLKRNSITIEVPRRKDSHNTGKISKLTRYLFNKVFHLGPKEIPCGNLYDL